MGETAARPQVLDVRPHGAKAFAARRTAASAARHYVELTLTAWGLTRLAEDAKLIVSELVTNALQHGGSGPIVVRCGIAEDGRFVMEVGDSSPELPELGAAGPLDVEGRGLVIVDALAAGWGARQVDGGKVIWAALRVE